MKNIVRLKKLNLFPLKIINRTLKCINVQDVTKAMANGRRDEAVPKKQPFNETVSSATIFVLQGCRVTSYAYILLSCGRPLGCVVGLRKVRLRLSRRIDAVTMQLSRLGRFKHQARGRSLDKNYEWLNLQPHPRDPCLIGTPRLLSINGARKREKSK